MSVFGIPVIQMSITPLISEIRVKPPTPPPSQSEYSTLINLIVMEVMKSLVVLDDSLHGRTPDEWLCGPKAAQYSWVQYCLCGFEDALMITRRICVASKLLFVWPDRNLVGQRTGSLDHTNPPAIISFKLRISVLLFTCEVCLFPLQSRCLLFLWCFFQVLPVKRASLRRTWDVLLLALQRLHPSFFRRNSRPLCAPPLLSRVKHTGSVEQWHLGDWDALPLEVTALQRLVQHEVKAPAFWSLVQVFAQGRLVLLLQLLVVDWAEQASSSRAVCQVA